MAVSHRKGPSATSGPTEFPAAMSGREPFAEDGIAVRDSTGNVFPNAYLGRRQLVVATLFALVSLALLVAGLGNPRRMYFDEGYFVPEARALIQGVPNPDPQAPPLAKPPLGRLIMAVGMKAAGDNSFGWRIAGGVCGALTVAAVYLWAFLLLQDSSLAFLAAGLALLNNFLFVMSRIATVDVFLMVFLMWSMVAYTAALVLPLHAGGRRFLVCLAGVLVGLAGACKWNAIDTLVVFVLVAFLLLVVSRFKVGASNLALSGYARNIAEAGVPFLLIALVVAPIAAYSLVF